ncbi:MAG: class I SAM-dependent methyltransferase [Verrucomicrobia bacterium]|nr:class I SAM-dependent methyltransferase [Verrucomicrobiota bacterium]MCH8512130.1 class I SAM-dependent methyltransferase [Kiritimatiellia bacterium]
MSLSPNLRKRLPAAWSPECWSVQYAFDRFQVWRYRRAHADLPWLTEGANEILIRHITPEDRVLEFGCGGSTLFFARHCQRVVSIEHNSDWHRLIANQLLDANLEPKVDLRLRPRESYAEAAKSLPDQHFDIVLVDGIRRAECVLASLGKLKPGGLLIVDNINRHVPNDSPGPGSLRAWDPDDSEHIQWQNLQHQLANWDQVWTCNGVTDTLLAYAPS